MTIIHDNNFRQVIDQHCPHVGFKIEAARRIASFVAWDARLLEERFNLIVKADKTIGKYDIVVGLFVFA